MRDEPQPNYLIKFDNSHLTMCKYYENEIQDIENKDCEVIENELSNN